MGITSIGIGSGLQVEDIISKTVALEKRPLTQLQNTASSIQTKISTYSQIKSLVSTLSDAASKLTRDSAWNGMAVTSSNSDAVAVSVSGIASATSFSMSVQQLARSQSVASGVVNKDAAVGAGTMAIQLGGWNSTTNPPAFTAGSTAAFNISVSATDTMTSIATKINEADGGVTATVLRDASGERLMLRSKTTGEESGFRIQVTEDSASPGLSKLAFDPQASPGTGMAGNSIQYAQNAQAKINGISVTSKTNVFADTIPGLTLTASKVTTEDVEVTSKSDTATMKKNIQDFVDAYNAVNDLLGSVTKYDSDTKTAGVLQGDGTTVGLQSTLRSAMTAATGGTEALQTLSDFGIQMQRGGKLTVDATKLDTALKTPETLKTFFAADPASGATSTGLGVRLKSLTASMLSFDGLMNNKSDALSAESKRNSDDQDKVNKRADTLEKRMRAQYTALDKQMANMSSLSTYMTQQIAKWNA
ncbi:flagellar filament capping protein FliD [Acidovorax sp. NCPPB 4044]|uniref:flagellar filament capping protein FliD n=1 Tax=Acidovorax sp. NCPPB 4044 TaxID=2940490 RepID=UPI00230409B6|nr:flagellar filament capping protein FliD [Acidovorax sp. NCPPB 4044]MDA8519155.1 flagellar filament capping protein FliD [Acidovorax sp. NCPPB 4044]